MNARPCPISVAPMLDWTDRHCRYFLRLISRHVRLYTEMVACAALIHGERERLLRFDAAEHPLALQLGGSEPEELARCARLGQERGYDEINLNVGCPSDRVQSGRFGACLMLEPQRVAEAVAAMRAAVSIAVTVKCRIGVDEHDHYETLADFTSRLQQAGVDALIVHARKAWLQGLSPKQNREVPPLRYDRVYRLKEDFPDLEIHLNGGVTTLDAAQEHLYRVDGVMIGRAVYHDPWLLAEVDRRFAGDDHPLPERRQVILDYLPYIETELGRGTPLQTITRHLLGLFKGRPGARAWRRTISEQAHRKGAGPEVLERALACLPESASSRSCDG
ncbi:MAG TPA: tRNA dihydrouridine(20/20a) synthase DusA [Gammaproteobacteria bacterium]|nr:tRNA dihydrouridine(20/20a) synthase DusA [Gammaproteobacteria bacterium]